MISGCSGMVTFEGVANEVGISPAVGFLAVSFGNFEVDGVCLSFAFVFVIAVGEIGSCTPNSATSVMYGRSSTIEGGKNKRSVWLISYATVDPFILRRLIWINKLVMADSSSIP